MARARAGGHGFQAAFDEAHTSAESSAFRSPIPTQTPLAYPNEDYGYTHDPNGYLLLKITQLIELLGIRHCVFLMGNPGTFKSALWKILKNAKTRRGEKTTVVDFSPKAITTNELYGFVNMQTREWKDGIISKVMRDLGQIPDSHPKWIMLDGDLDANWIESMNSVMDDNRLLTLPSNERIPLKACDVRSQSIQLNIDTL